MFLKKGITITSRGCVRNCEFCFVRKREGFLRELEIKPGNIIQDNNILSCSKKHVEGVFDMLKTQRKIEFKGGIDTRLLKEWHVEKMRGLKIKRIFLACDTKEEVKNLKRAAQLLTPYFSRDKLFCYCLIKDDLKEGESRLKEVYASGINPFAMGFRDINGKKAEVVENNKEFFNFWTRPAAYRTEIKRNGLDKAGFCKDSRNGKYKKQAGQTAGMGF